MTVGGGEIKDGGVIKMDGDYWDVILLARGGRTVDLLSKTETLDITLRVSRQLEHDEAVEAAGRSYGEGWPAMVDRSREKR